MPTEKRAFGRFRSVVLVLIGVLAAVAISGYAYHRAFRGSQPVHDVLTPLTIEDLSELRDGFNATPGARMIVFFTAQCKSCDEAAADLQALLDRSQIPLSAIVVWE